MSTEPCHGLLDLVNARGLGGLRTVGGGVTRCGLLYRSESLATVSERDQSTLTQRLGVSNVIDLRAPMEVEHRPAEWTRREGISYTNLPMSDGFDALPESLSEQELLGLVPEKYLRYLVHAGPDVAKAIASIANAAEEGRATLFACTYGKDRTGVLAMLVLDLLDVQRDAIVEDYVASAPAMPELMSRMAADALHGPRIRLAPAQVYEATKYSAEAFLRGLDERGGAGAWAIDAGLSRSDIDRLHHALITNPHPAVA